MRWSSSFCPVPGYPNSHQTWEQKWHLGILLMSLTICCVIADVNVDNNREPRGACNRGDANIESASTRAAGVTINTHTCIDSGNANDSQQQTKTASKSCNPK
eukprot:scaffold69832_cov21-Prasinocladus_malaysianus.AAC.1